jgi:CubicO group peptidase (beta-lactamase class C family)
LAGTSRASAESPDCIGRARGYVAPGFGRVLAEFERNFVERGEEGAAFVALVDGVVVADLWGGTAEAPVKRAWDADTLVPIFSGTKGLVATCLARLIEQGQLQLEVPVCHYWPEFGEQGKSNILVRHVVSHETGVPGLDTPVSVVEATDGVAMASLLAAQTPTGAAGTWQAYHAMTFGWLAGELIRRITGRSVGQFFASEIAGALGLEAWIGLPASLEPRVAKIRVGEDFSPGNEAAPDDKAPRDRLAWSIWSNPPRFANGLLAANATAWHQAEIPATSGVAAPRSVARLYGCLARGGELDGIRLLHESTINLARTRIGGGCDPYLNSEMAFGVGFQLQTPAMTFGPAPDAFGHAGVGGSVHGAWPGLRAGFSYTTNLLHGSDSGDARGRALLDALHSALQQ